ncbi:MAG TPA: MCE family protein [Marmoricola sp.]|nr:MCE family protein [Marmoricola sp.]
MIKKLTATITVLAVLAVVLVVGGRHLFRNPNDFVLPGGVATGSDGYRVSATFANVENLVPNSKVMYNNVAIGTVTAIKLKGWQAKVTLSLKKSIRLPKTATFRIAQQSLLGSEYVEADVSGGAATTTGASLSGGDAVTVAQTGNYPETEDVLSAVSLVLNGGGLSQLKTITTELTRMIGAPQQQQNARDLLTKTNQFLTSVNSNKANIIRLIAQLNRFAGTFARQKAAVAKAIVHIRPGLAVLNDEKTKLVDALTALSKFGTIGTRIIRRDGDALVSNLQNLEPVLTKLQESGDALPQSLQLIPTFPFPLKTTPIAVRGDFANFFPTIDVSLPQLTANFLGGPADESGDSMPSTAFERFDPFFGPLTVHSATPPATTKKSTKKPARGSTSSTGSSSAPTAPAAPTSPTKPCNIIAAILGGC